MQILKILAASAAVGMAAGGALATDGPKLDPVEVATAFCSTRVAGDDAATLALASGSLAEVIDAALTRNARVQDATPDEKPPLGDGIPWQAFPDRASACTPGAPEASGSNYLVGVTYSFPDQPNGSWTDTLKLVPDGDRLAVDDVFYPQAANDSSRPGLRRLLFDSFDL